MGDITVVCDGYYFFSLDTDLTNVLNGYRGPVKSMSYLNAS